MKRFVSIAILLLGAWISACGGTGRGVRTGSPSSSGGPASGQETAPLATDATRTAGHLFGDYDGDDYYIQKSSDLDNDDGHKPRDGDGDYDNRSKSYFDSDDGPVLRFGHAASTADRRAIEAVVKRYFAAAATKDGAAACSIITTPLAKSVPEDLGQPPGPAFLSGKTCAVVMSKLFKESSLQFTTYAKRLRVVGVRLDRGRGFAILGFRDLPGRRIDVAREGGVWKIQALVDGELP